MTPRPKNHDVTDLRENSLMFVDFNLKEEGRGQLTEQDESQIGEHEHENVADRSDVHFKQDISNQRLGYFTKSAYSFENSG